LSSNAAPLSIREALELAESHNLSYFQKKSSKESADLDITVSRSPLLPKLLVESSADYLRPTSSKQSSTWKSDVSLVLRQSLYDGGQAWAQLSRSQITRDRVTLEEKAARESLGLDLIKIFVDCSRSERRLSLAQRKLKILETQKDLVSRQYRQGLKMQQDYQLLEAEFERAQLEVDRQETDLFAAYRQLEILIGNPDLHVGPSDLKTFTGQSILTLKDWRPLEQSKSALANYDVRIAELSVQEKDIDLDLARKQYWPVLTAQAALGYPFYQSPETKRSQSYETTVGLNLSWTLWDWGGTSAKVAKARLESDQLLRAYQQKKLDSQNQNFIRWESLKRQSKALQALEKIRRLEKNSFNNIQGDYREGRASYLDFVTAISRDLDAEQKFESEAFDYFLSVAELLKDQGVLYEKIKTL
jgi:outer membrane protein TolC